MARYYDENNAAQQGNDTAYEAQYADAQFEDENTVGEVENEGAFEQEQYAEEQYAEAQDEYNPERNDFEGTHLRKLLDFMTKIVEEAPALRNGRCSLERQVCKDVIADIRECIPKAVRAAWLVWDKRENILSSAEATAKRKVERADARADKSLEEAELQVRNMLEDAQNRANDILEQARTRAQAMIADSEIVRCAHEAADKICNDARNDADEVRRDAKRYTEELLRELEQDILATLAAVQGSQKNFSEEE